MLYRVTNNLVEVPQDYHPQLRSRQPARGNQQEYQRLTPNVEAFQYSFLPRTIVDWNGLNKTVAAADSLESFRRLLYWTELCFFPSPSCHLNGLHRLMKRKTSAILSIWTSAEYLSRLLVNVQLPSYLISRCVWRGKTDAWSMWACAHENNPGNRRIGLTQQCLQSQHGVHDGR